MRSNELSMPKDSVEALIQFEWLPVEVEPGVPYLFPNPLSRHVHSTCKGPALYRWNVFRQTPGDLRVFYVGEAVQLVRRLRNYLRPGSLQTAGRINAELSAVVEAGKSVMLERLSFSPFSLSGRTVTPDDLEDRHIRRFIESWLILHHICCGHRVLNR